MHSWCSREGWIPGAHYWTGEKWADNEINPPSIGFWPIRFETQAGADDYAYEHDWNA
jgi:hypothetical protein